MLRADAEGATALPHRFARGGYAVAEGGAAARGGGSAGGACAELTAEVTAAHPLRWPRRHRGATSALGAAPRQHVGGHHLTRELREAVRCSPTRAARLACTLVPPPRASAELLPRLAAAQPWRCCRPTRSMDDVVEQASSTGALAAAAERAEARRSNLEKELEDARARLAEQAKAGRKSRRACPPSSARHPQARPAGLRIHSSQRRNPCSFRRWPC